MKRIIILAAIFIITARLNAIYINEKNLEEKALPLDKIIKTAIKNNFDIDYQKYIIYDEKEDLASAFSTFDPDLDISLNYDYSKENTIGTSLEKDKVSSLSTSLTYNTKYSSSFTLAHSLSKTNNNLSSPANNFNNSFSLSFTQPILKGRGKEITLAPIKEQEFLLNSAEYSYLRFIEQTIYNIIIIYLDLAESEFSQKVAVESLKNANIILDRNQKLNEKKLISDLDVLTAQRGVYSREAIVLETEKQRLNIAEQLIFLVYGKKSNNNLVDRNNIIKTENINLDLLEPEMQDIDKIIDSAFENRFDLIEYKEILSQKQIALKTSEDNLKPQLNMTISLSKGGEGENFKIFYDNNSDIKNDEYTGAIAFSFPLGNTSSKSEYNKAAFDIEKQEILIEKKQNEIIEQVRKAYRTVKLNKQKLNRNKQASKYALATYIKAKKSNELGLIDTFKLLQYEDDVRNAQTDEIKTEYALYRSIVNLHFATGQLLKKYIDINKIMQDIRIRGIKK